MRPNRGEITLLLVLLLVALYARLHNSGVIGVPSLGLILVLPARATSVVLTYWLGRRIGGPGVGLPAAFFLAVAGSHGIGFVVMSIGEPAGCALLLGLLELFRVQERYAKQDFAWAAGWIGLAGGLSLPCSVVGALIWSADGLRSINITRAVASPPTFAARGLLPAGVGLVIGGIGGWLWRAGNPLGLLGADANAAPSVDLWTALGAGLGSPLLGLALAGGAVAILRRSPKGLLLTGAALLLLPVQALWAESSQAAITSALPLLVLLAALALRTTVGSLLSPALAQARALTLNTHSDLVRALTAGRVLRLLSPALLTVGTLLLAMPLWLGLLP